MRKSGKMVRELLACWGLTEADLAMALLEETAHAGGEPAAASVRKVVMSSRRLQSEQILRAERAERDLWHAQASLRAMVGQVMPGDARVVMDPPAGHEWSTGVRAAAGRLFCVQCTAALGLAPHSENGVGVVLAAECLERARAAESEPMAPCEFCGVVHL